MVKSNVKRKASCSDEFIVVLFSIIFDAMKMKTNGMIDFAKVLFAEKKYSLKLEKLVLRIDFYSSIIGTLIIDDCIKTMRFLWLKNRLLSHFADVFNMVFRSQFRARGWMES